ncbi:MAG: hypothetical protein OXF79_00805 [Chloroflexi bacterium]|nr:hypothetical protein [Chloroflexota bacterium]
MTTINTSEDLLRLLREDAHFYEQARRLILTDELITLPERFAAFAARVDGFIVQQEQFNQRVDGFIVQQEQFNQRVDSRFDRIEGDLSHFKNRFSESQVADEAATIAMAMGFTLVRVLSNSDLVQMSQHPGARSVAQNDLISFTRADLVLEVSDQEGNLEFIPVEISYTADLRDTDRARRNADYITRFTGQPAHAAVASARNDHNIQGLIDRGTVWWYPLEDHTDGAETR